MNKKRFIRLCGAAALCVLFAACNAANPGYEEYLLGGTVSERDLTDLVRPPEAGTLFSAGFKTAQFTAAVEWRQADMSGDYGPVSGYYFEVNVHYAALITMKAAKGYTFKGVEKDSFYHQKGKAENVEGTRTVLGVSVVFPATPNAGDKIITATNLEAAIAAPVKYSIPQAVFQQTQYRGGITWRTADGANLSGDFEPGTAYRATFILNPENGWTLTGLDENSFSHPAAQEISYDLISGRVNILFFPTTEAGVPDPVTFFDLTNIVPVPVSGESPLPFVLPPSPRQYYADSVDYYYVEGSTETPILPGETFVSGKEIKVEFDLTAMSRRTFDGVPADTFFHPGAASVGNAAGSGRVTIYFPEIGWIPATITYPSLTGRTMQACCWAGDNNSVNRPGILINVANPDTGTPGNGNHWDYGWNSAANNNSSSWPEVFSTGITMDGDECGKGHPSALLGSDVPEAIRRCAHVFTLDLGAVTNGIVRFGMFPRQNENAAQRGDRWPIQFEVFYSNSAIGPIFDTGDGNITSLGVFTWEQVPDPFAWRDVNLYERSANGGPVSARYIHFRVYAEGKNGTGAEWICPSFGQIRIGVEQN